MVYRGILVFHADGCTLWKFASAASILVIALDWAGDPAIVKICKGLTQGPPFISYNLSPGFCSGTDGE
jgi:hypothetical protein